MKRKLKRIDSCDILIMVIILIAIIIIGFTIYSIINLLKPSTLYETPDAPFEIVESFKDYKILKFKATNVYYIYDMKHQEEFGPLINQDGTAYNYEER